MISRRALLSAALPLLTLRQIQAEETVSDPVKQARDFLAGLFDPTLDLLPEFRGSKTYWLFHDNYLAARVLKPVRPDLTEKIEGALKRHGHTVSGKIEIVLGESPKPLPFRHYELIDVAKADGKLIRTEVVTDRLFPGWEPYADLLLLAAMAEPDEAKARDHFAAARKMWNGKGFHDQVVPGAGRYATYKPALALIAAKRRSFDFPESAAVRACLLARRHSDGGFITDYTPEGVNVGFANVETTSLCVLALE